MELAQTLLKREPRPFPKLRLLRRPDSIDGYRIEDFDVTGYDPHPAIEAPVAV
jgi:thymidylate synthase